jgi:hypothetical protein
MPAKVRHVQFQCPTIPQAFPAEKIPDNKWRSYFDIKDLIRRDDLCTEEGG